MNSKALIPVVFLLISLVIYFIIEIYNNKKNFNESYSGIITFISKGRGGKHYYYNENKYFTDDEFNIKRNSDKIAIGDSISKTKQSLSLYVFRKNKDNIYTFKFKFIGK